MITQSFTWKDTKSDAMGIIVSEFPPIVKPKERVTNVTIPGRSGSLTVTEGDDIYEPYVKNCKCILTKEADIHSVCAWLRGKGLVTFDNEPEYAYEARIVNQIDFSKFARNGMREFTVPFYCQPLKLKTQNETPQEFTSSGQYIRNNGDVRCYPIIKITAKGSMQLTVGGTKINIKDLTDGIVINWQNAESYSLDGSTNLNTHVSGKIQSLPVGRSRVTWSKTSEASGDGITSVQITKNERFL